jgi:hypothetical protein
MRILIPAYFYPGKDWARLSDLASLMPGKIYAIANPSSGPGKAEDKNYSRAIKDLKNNRGHVIGYVHTSYGKRPVSSVKNDIDLWYNFYPVEGIFLDEQANTPGKEEYYLELYSYIKSKDKGALVAGNPGAETTESYLFYDKRRVADVLCLFENSQGFLSLKPPGWIYNYNKDNFCVIPYNIGSDGYKDCVDHADNINIGWIYCTNGTLPNPWNTLPEYFESFSDYVNTRGF